MNTDMTEANLFFLCVSFVFIVASATAYSFGSASRGGLIATGGFFIGAVITALVAIW